MDTKHLRTLECPICYEVPRDRNIYICVNGHMICSKCHKEGKIELCPVGKCSYHDPPTRMLSMEKFIQESGLEYPCKNEMLGCKFKGSIFHLNEHEVVGCDFSTVPCPGLSCSKIVSGNGLIEHIREQHQGTLWAKTSNVHGQFATSGGCVSDTYGWPLAITEYQGKWFLFKLQRSTNAIFHALVYVIGNQKTSEDFTVTIRIEGNGSVHQKACKVHPIESAGNTILRDEDCFHVTRRQVKQCVTYDNSLGGKDSATLQFNFKIDRKANANDFYKTGAKEASRIGAEESNKSGTEEPDKSGAKGPSSSGAKKAKKLGLFSRIFRRTRTVSTVKKSPDISGEENNEK